MKIFAIRNHEAEETGDLAYLFYHEKIEEYYIEIREEIGYWDLPFVLDSYVKRGLRTVSMTDTMRFIEGRIIPKDRQNIGEILKVNGLEEYDEMKLFLMADGRCAQDECYIRKITEEKLPEEIKKRRRKRITGAYSAGEYSFLMSLADGSTVLAEMRGAENDSRIARLMAYAELFQRPHVRLGGMGLLFDNGTEITYEYLNRKSTVLPISSDQIMGLARNMIYSTQDMIQILHCSRQNINDLVNRKRMVPWETNTKEYLFQKTEIDKII